MRNIYRSLLLILAGATQRDLARYVRYLKTENEVPVRRGYRRKTVDEPSSVPLSTIGCKSRLGGLLKHYYRKAA